MISPHRFQIQVQIIDNNTISIALIKNLETMTKKAGAALSGSVAVNVILSLVLGFSLKQLWLLMNTLQIITHLPLLNFSLPSIFILFTETLKSISNMDILPDDWMQNIKSALIPASFQDFSSGTKKESLGLLFISLPLSALVLIGIIVASIFLKRSER